MIAGQGRAFHTEIVIPFTIVTLIWGSTWLVIRDQISTVSISWSVTYRFALAAVAMFGIVWHRKLPVAIGRKELLVAFGVGASQFAINFNLVYRAELYITSGLVAVIYALLMIPNSIMSRLFYGHRATSSFILGSAISVAGLALMFLHEYHVSHVDPGGIVLGLALGIAGVCMASVSNILQISNVARRAPVLSLLAWAMVFSTIINATIALIVSGMPSFDSRPAYIAGIVYLALAGSVVSFPLYAKLIQRIGAGRAAYVSVLIPIVAMLLSTLFEAYSWSLLSIAGASLALAGMIVAMRGRAALPESSEASPSLKVG